MVKKKTAQWDKKTPAKPKKKLTARDKQKARSLAKKAGRPYPNLLDNMRVARKKTKKK